MSAAEPAANAIHPRYRGPVIDAHCHYHASTQAWAPTVNRVGGLQAAINLWDISWPPTPDALEWPEHGRSLLCCHNPDISHIGLPGFEKELETDLRKAADAGCVGIKVWKHLGLWMRDTSGKRLAVDDRRLDILWETAAELDLPIAIHVGDPPAFFAPIDDNNPRIEELRAHPEWWYGGGDYASLEQIHDELEQLVARHPQTTFIAVHFGCCMPLDEVRRMLTTYPNYMIDTAAAIADLGRESRPAVREVFTTFPTRVIFGTDLIRTPDYNMPDLGQDPWALNDFFAAHWQFFETPDAELAHPLPAQGHWTVDGLDLPNELLSHLYWQNAVDVFRIPSRITQPTS